MALDVEKMWAALLANEHMRKKSDNELAATKQVFTHFEEALADILDAKMTEVVFLDADARIARLFLSDEYVGALRADVQRNSPDTAEATVADYIRMVSGSVARKETSLAACRAGAEHYRTGVVTRLFGELGAKHDVDIATFTLREFTERFSGHFL